MDITRKVIDAMKRYILQQEVAPSADEIDMNWEEISERVKRAGRRRRLRIIIGAAAAAAVPLGLWYAWRLVAPMPPAKQKIEVYALRTPPSYDVSEDSIVTLVMSDGSEMQIRSDEAYVDHDAEGNLSLNHDPAPVCQKHGDNYNQLIVPYGCRSNLTLSDGSRIWINSGSRVVYPAKFEGDTREIYLEGEGYLEVKPDKTKPFIVKTARMNVEVTGTKFNVFAYPQEIRSEVALAQGAVSVCNEKSRQKMVPGQIVAADRSGTISQPHNGDVASRISWTRNVLVFDDDPIEAVLKRLNLYYGKKFVTSADLGNFHITGKLDMSGGLESILGSLSFSVPIVFEQVDDTSYRIRRL